ncbi:MAG: M15 family metallopeptidase [Epsilonproteobacteria bacterium]|nr:M15 family metallopeptidase [Campylobacterota bacterium]
MLEHLISEPIPYEKEISWETVYSTPLVDCEEKLVPLSLAPEKILVRSTYFEAGIAGSIPECYARSKLLKKLIKASKLLPKNLRFVILDAWRNQQVQTSLFQQCKLALSAVNPNINDEKLNILAQQYVAVPSTKISAPSPHSTGGAVDLTISTKDGVVLFFGSPFDYPSEISYTRFFEKKFERGDIISKKEREAMRNRRLLYNIMKIAGFVNFPCEWWHYEYGTQRWAIENKKKEAIYGATSLCLNSFEAFLRTNKHRFTK